jgi:hypothetical protein
MAAIAIAIINSISVKPRSGNPPVRKLAGNLLLPARAAVPLGR